jgi:uncharacterized protein (UPF0335 family)
MSQQSDYIQRLQQQQLNIQQRYTQQQAQQPQPQQAPQQAPQHPAPQTYQSSNKTTQNITQDVSSTESNTITKEQVKDYLRQWIRVENEISTLTQEIKKRKLIHQQLSSSLMNVMRKNEIDCFDITNGKIVYSKTKTRPPLNKGQLKNALLTYYKDDTESANSLNEFLVASRVEKVKEAIKMKIPK